MKNSYADPGTSPLQTSQGYGDMHRFGTTLDGIVAVARRTWRKNRKNVSVQPPAHVDSAQLCDAFRVFTDAAAKLEDTYTTLQSRVDELSLQLAQANSELTRELKLKQTLVDRQSTLLAALPAGVVVVDAKGMVREANATAEGLLGAFLVGRRWTEAVTVLTPTGSAHEWLTHGDQPRRIDIREQIVDANGERIVLLHDLTEAHAERMDLARNERLASMGEMAARLAHQLRTPLSTAMLYAGQLERPELTLADRSNIGEKILSRLRSLERVTRDMLRFVRGEQALEHSIEVSSLLRDAAQVIEPLMAARGIGFSWEDHTAGTVLRGDRRGLGAALLSLLENAVQSTPQGGKVRVSAMANSTRVRIQVIDSGTGIPEHALPRLFEPFYSTRSDGTGLGLAIVKSVVDAHGGTIEVQSTADAGTSFTLILPCASESRPLAAMPPSTSEPALHRSSMTALDREAA